MHIEIDSESGFCFGVTRAIKMAEEELSREGNLYCIGDIVHNENECERLRQMGLTTIDHDKFSRLKNTRVLLRAHGEPPCTYSTARRLGITLIDATCPVVLRLQERIKKTYIRQKGTNAQIAIFGKKGHAEVEGLVGQTEGTAIVIESAADINRLDLNRPICLFSQTTKPLEEFRHIANMLQEKSTATVASAETVCSFVARRTAHVRQFAVNFDAILFVCGKKSSNGRMLFAECCEVNSQSYMIGDYSEIPFDLLSNCNSVGICGATSTPRHLMETCACALVEKFG